MTLAPLAAAWRTNVSALARLSSRTLVQLICTMASRRSLVRCGPLCDADFVAAVVSGTVHLSLRLLLRHAMERATAGDETGCAQADDFAAGEQGTQDAQRDLVVDVGVLRDHYEAVADVEVGVGRREALAFELHASQRQWQLDYAVGRAVRSPERP